MKTDGLLLMSNGVSSFEQAMRVTISCCDAWDKGEISDEVLADKVAELVTTRDGTRGFFVISMASDYPLLDRLPDCLLIQLRAAGAIVVDIIVRNLAMSSAMVLHHQRNADKTQQEGSERVKVRCIELLRSLDPKIVKQRLERLLLGINGKGEDVSFLERWNYDKEQILEILSSVNSVAE